MPATLIPLALKILGPIVLVLAVVGGGFAYLKHAEHAAAAAARAQAIAEMKAATDKESQRRDQVAAWWQKWAQGAVEQAQSRDSDIAKLQAEAARLSAKNDRTPAFNAAAAARIGAIKR